MINKLERRFSSFIEATFKGKPKKHRKLWDSMALLLSAGGLGVRSIRLVMKSLGMEVARNFLNSFPYGGLIFGINLSRMLILCLILLLTQQLSTTEISDLV